MGSLLTNTCWPSRFWVKSLAIFLGALALGMILAVLFRPGPPPQKQIQALVQVLVSYADGPGPQPVDAKIYFARSAEEMSEQQQFSVSKKAAARRTQTAGLALDFMVQPLDEKGGREGSPVPYTVTWPKENGKPVNIPITRPYPQPGQTSPVKTSVIKEPVTPPSGVNYDWLSERPVTDADLRGKTRADLRVMRNWIFARHGHRFTDPELQNFFKEQRWYRPGSSETQSSELERENAGKLREAEARL